MSEFVLLTPVKTRPVLVITGVLPEHERSSHCACGGSRNCPPTRRGKSGARGKDEALFYLRPDSFPGLPVENAAIVTSLLRLPVSAIDRRDIARLAERERAARRARAGRPRARAEARRNDRREGATAYSRRLGASRLAPDRSAASSRGAPSAVRPERRCVAFSTARSTAEPERVLPGNRELTGAVELSVPTRLPVALPAVTSDFGGRARKTWTTRQAMPGRAGSRRGL